MIQLGKKVFSSVLASFVALSLAACGGGGHHGSALPPAAQAPGGLSPDAFVPATFTIKIPAPTKSSSKSRRPSYISAATQSVRVNMTSDSAGVAITSQFNVLTQVTNGTGNSPGAPCTGSGPWTCTVTLKVPPGSDTFTFTTYDDTTGTGTGASHILSQQIQTLTVVKAIANTFTITFDANVNTFAISTTSGFCAGSFTVAANQNVPTVGTSTLTFSGSYTDLANKTIVGPGLPLLKVNTHSDDNSGAGYNDPGTGGTINVKVNQSTQTFTVTPSGSGLTSASVAVTITPPNSDGLSFSKAVTFTVSSGAAPASGLLAAVEQTNSTPGSMAGQVDLFLMNNPADPTGFSSTPVTPSKITPAGSPSKDVDNPQDMVFDPNGDLLIANGGAGNPDFGNFACIPAGVITAASPSDASVTVLASNGSTAHFDDPASLALGADSSVALGNYAAGPTHAADFVLSGTYSEATSTREVTNSDFSGGGALNVTPICTPQSGGNPCTSASSATNPAGTYAVSISTGANPPLGNSCNPNNGTNPAGNSSEVFIRRPNGTSTVINDSNVQIVEPLVAYDSADSRLVVLSTGACNAASSVTGSTAYLTTWNIDASTTATNTSSQFLFSAGGSPASSQFTYGHCCIATSSTGYVAIAGTLTDLNTGVTGPIVQVFQPGTGARSTQGAPIPFNGTSQADTCGTAACQHSVYCASSNVCFVNSLKFLSPTKLLIGFQSDNNTYQGFYLYNVGATGATVAPCAPGSCFDVNGSAYGNGPVFLDFKHTTNHPLASAYHP